MGKANKIRDIKIVGWGIRGLGKDKDGDGMTDEGRGNWGHLL